MKKDHNIEPADSERIETLSGRGALLVSEAHTKVAVSVNRTLVYTYYEIGRYIVEDEQNGRDKAAYGKRILSALSDRLTERLALSRDNGSVMKLAIEGQAITKPTDILKDPISLEFLGLKPDNSYSETNLENAIIDKLQQFLLEMGKGFLFEARPKGAPAKTERMD